MGREVRPPISAHDPVVGAFDGDHFLPQVEQGRFAGLAFLLPRLHDYGMGVLSVVSIHLHHLRCSLQLPDLRREESGPCSPGCRRGPEYHVLL